MSAPHLPSGRRMVLGLLGAVAALAALIAPRSPPLALVNESPSLPRGVYLLDAGAGPGRAAIVATAQPAAARAYLSGLGMPADTLLIKRVAGVGGDVACRHGAVVTVAGRSVKALSRDRRGAALPAWSGCRQLEADALFLLGDTPSSFDSRYFGTVRRSEAAGVYRRVLTW